MTIFKNIQSITHKKTDLIIQDQQDRIIEAGHLTVLPGLIDPHVHFRTPGLEHKEDWCTAAKASVYGGYTTVFDMPNTLPPTITAELLAEKKALINQQLQAANIPLNYELFFGADKNHLQQIPKVKHEIIGIKVFMGCSTGNLVIDDDESLEAVFKIAAENDLLVAVHAEDEHLMRENAKQFPLPQPYTTHSQIRNETVAKIAVTKAIHLARLYQTKLYILHVSTAEEIALIQQAKAEGLAVYGETTPHHLFLNTFDYETLHGKAIMNPPLRNVHHQEQLFNAIHAGVIDTIGSDHAPHTKDEKAKPYGSCPSGVPGIETTLPLLLNAYHNKLLTLEEIVKLTSQNAQTIFNLKTTENYTIVDLNKTAIVDEKKLRTKCQWSPFAGRKLTGWPVYTILNNRVYDLAS
jgi:dihydroorotase